MKRIFIVLIFLGFTFGLFAQDMRQNAFSSLFSDQKASRVGDAITILVLESSTASNNAELSTGKSSDLGFTAGGNTLKKGIDVGINSKNNFNGSGATKTTGMIQTKISATIDSVLANGNLVIKGSRKIVINGEEQNISIKGVVRSSDIMADNSVYSYNISEAEIVLDGDGKINSSLSPGWLTKFLHWIF